MNGVRKVTEDLYWVGVNDKRIELFENIHPIPEGVSYNAYLLLDEKTVLFDTVDWSGCRVFLENIAAVLDGRKLDYLVVNHMEPDHAASLEEVLIRYPECKVISNEKAFMFMRQFGFDVDGPYGREFLVQPFVLLRGKMFRQTYSDIPDGADGALAGSHGDI